MMLLCLENAKLPGVPGGAQEGSSGHSRGVWFQSPKPISARDLHQPWLRQVPGPWWGHMGHLHTRSQGLLPAPERNPQLRGVRRENFPCVLGQLTGAGHVWSRIGAGRARTFL